MTWSRQVLHLCSLLIQILPEKYMEFKSRIFDCNSGEGHILLQRVTANRFLDKADRFISNYVTVKCPKIFAGNYCRQNKTENPYHCGVTQITKGISRLLNIFFNIIITLVIFKISRTLPSWSFLVTT
jgi:hypothetical protein